MKTIFRKNFNSANMPSSSLSSSWQMPHPTPTHQQVHATVAAKVPTCPPYARLRSASLLLPFPTRLHLAGAPQICSHCPSPTLSIHPSLSSRGGPGNLILRCQLALSRPCTRYCQLTSSCLISPTLASLSDLFSPSTSHSSEALLPNPQLSSLLLTAPTDMMAKDRCRHAGSQEPGHINHQHAAQQLPVRSMRHPLTAFTLPFIGLRASKCARTHKYVCTCHSRPVYTNSAVAALLSQPRFLCCSPLIGQLPVEQQRGGK